MRTRIARAALCALLCLCMLFSFNTVSTYAEGTHGFYMTCYSDVTDRKSDGFMIDFYSDSPDALCTYWSNANWSMYTTESIRKLGYKSITGGGAYAGLQIRYSSSDRVGIMSMWRYEYRDKGKITYLYADCMYGANTHYDNEGSGTSCILPYAWKSGQWYKELLYCWTDEETGYTFIGTWYYDYEADEWFLLTYYNTKLADSYIQGDIGQFLENYLDTYNDRYRSFRYKGIYFLSHDSKEWVSSPTVYLRSDGNAKAVGEAKQGVSDDKTYVWASVDGASTIDTDNTLSLKVRLNQPQKPSYGTPAVKELKADALPTISWTVADNSTPQLGYKVVVSDVEGNVLKTLSGTRPEVRKVEVGDVGTDAYKCELTLTDVFGQTVAESYTSPRYDAIKSGEEQPSDGTPEETGTPAETVTESASPTNEPASTPGGPETTTDGEEETPKEKTWIWIACGACAAAAVIGTLLVLKRRKKNKKS